MFRSYSNAFAICHRPLCIKASFGPRQANLVLIAYAPEPPLLAHTSSESRGTFRQKARSLAPLNDWACAVKICHDGMLEDTNSLDAAHFVTSIHKVHINNPSFYCLIINITFERRTGKKRRKTAQPSENTTAAF